MTDIRGCETRYKRFYFRFRHICIGTLGNWGQPRGDTGTLFLVSLFFCVYVFTIPLLFETGMRKEEILGLEWSDIHDGLIHITKAYTGLKGGRSKAILKETKNKGSIRTVPVTATLEKALRRHRALQGNKTFVVSKKDTNERMKPSFFDDKFRKYRQKAMIVENITPHSCRHFYASQLFAHGIPVNEGMRLTGHTTLKTYMLYAYVDKPSETTTDKLLKAMQDISPIEI